MKKIIHFILHLPYVGPAIGFYFGVKGYNRIKAKIIRPVGQHLTIRDLFLNVMPSFNSRVNKGADLIGSLITGTSLNSITSPLPPKYIALSPTTLTPAATDTTLSGETSNSGLSRALGTQGSYTGPSSLDGAASYTVSNTFTCGATSTTIASAALLDAASTGNLFVEANLSSSAALTNGVQLQIVWTVNY
jgi:hypothetical protein